MSRNLLVWKWSPETGRKKPKFADITSAFLETEDHPAIGEAEMKPFLDRVFEEFGPESPDLPFVVERYAKCVVFNYGESARMEIVPKLGRLASSFGFNASEF